jgi:hypothetical protein
VAYGKEWRMPNNGPPPNLPDPGRSVQADVRQYRTPRLDHAVRMAEQYNDKRTANSARRMIEAGGRMSPPPGYFTQKSRKAGKRTTSSR